MDPKRPVQDVQARTKGEDAMSSAIETSLKVGAACGGAGFLVGGTAGIIRGAPPFLFGAASAFQTFTLGTAFWGCRTAILHAWTPHQTPSDLVKASAISGGITGGVVGLLTRGRSNAVPGAIMMSLFGFLGQTAYNSFSVRTEDSASSTPGFWRRMSEKKFSPVTVLSDEQYAAMLQEKMLKVDAEIAIIEDRINALKERQQADTAHDGER